MKRIAPLTLLLLAALIVLVLVTCAPTPTPEFTETEVEARVERYVSGLRCAPPYSRSCRDIRDITTVATYQGKGMWKVSLRGVVGVSTAKPVSTPTPSLSAPRIDKAKAKENWLKKQQNRTPVPAGVVGTSAVQQTPIPVEVASSWHFWEESRVITPADEASRLIVMATLVYDMATLESRIDEMDYLVARLREATDDLDSLVAELQEAVGTPERGWLFSSSDDLFSRTNDLSSLVEELQEAVDRLERRVGLR